MAKKTPRIRDIIDFELAIQILLKIPNYVCKINYMGVISVYAKIHIVIVGEGK